MVKRMIKVFGCTLLACVILAGCGEPKTKNRAIQIGITQIVEHPALDKAREGFIDELRKNGYEDGKQIRIDFQNAQGDMATAQTIAKNFVSQKKDLIFAVATPTAQAAFNSTKEIPIMITAVTDPVKAGLVRKWEKSDTNVAGTSDATPVQKQLELLKQLIPSAKKIGILYNTSETNSEVQVEMLKKAASKDQLEVVIAGVTNTNEVSQALDSLLGKIDVLYTPADNLVASSMALIYSQSMKRQIPIIGAERAHVEAGALATEGIDYYELGKETGMMAIEVLEGKNPKYMSVKTSQNTKLTINQTVANNLNIKISPKLQKQAEIIEMGGLK